jgi:hypothetical protein
MAYQSISHARSHRAPFAGLGRAPGYMGNYCSDGMAGPSPGDAGYRALARHASLGNSTKSASTGGGDMLQSAISAFTGGGGGAGGGGGSGAKAGTSAGSLTSAVSSYLGAGGGGGGAAAAGGGAAVWGTVAAEALKTTSTIVDAAVGGPQKRERESRRNLEIARLQAQAAGGNAAAQIEIARLQAEAAVESARLAGQAGDASTKKLMMIGGGVALLAVLGIGAAVVLKK